MAHKSRRDSPAPRPEQRLRIKPEIQHQMRGLIQATRAPRARRFVTPVQVQERINALLRSTIHEYNQISRRKIPTREIVATQVSGRLPVHQSPMLRNRLPAQVRNVFQDVERALQCSRRETRREVMFALRRTGKAGRGNKKARWTWRSRLSCK